ncbi:dihydropteroate synthase [Amycolatopsis alkalitolerans]
MTTLPELDRCVVMAVVNVTPDSFSDGGLFFETKAAIAHGMGLLRAGADIIDVGGESTRPGAGRVPADEELRRVLPVVSELSAAGASVSIDTTRACVAEAAVDAGARIVNDVSGGLADPLMPRFVAHADVPYILMHWRGPSTQMQRNAHYGDVVTEVAAELQQRLCAVVDAGVRADQIVLDPGLGFAKTAEHNWRLLAHLDVLKQLGRPLLIGASRKSFLGELLAGEGGAKTPTDERDAASAAVAALAAATGVWGVRAHTVPLTLDAVRVAAALRAAA